MKIIPTENIMQLTDVTNISDISDELEFPEAPVIVIFSENIMKLSDKERAYLKNCSALTVIAGENLSDISESVLSEFDLRITEQYSNILKNDTSCKKLCGENAAYQYSQSKDISEFFFTFLKGEQPFYEKVMQYLSYLIKDKSKFQLYSLAQCFRAARSSTSEVLKQESLQFYRLMQYKSKEASHETNA